MTLTHAWRLTRGSSVHPGRWHYVSDVREHNLLRQAGQRSALRPSKAARIRAVPSPSVYRTRRAWIIRNSRQPLRGRRRSRAFACRARGPTG